MRVLWQKESKAGHLVEYWKTTCRRHGNKQRNSMSKMENHLYSSQVFYQTSRKKNFVLAVRFRLGSLHSRSKTNRRERWVGKRSNGNKVRSGKNESSPADRSRQRIQEIQLWESMEILGILEQLLVSENLKNRLETKNIYIYIATFLHPKCVSRVKNLINSNL